MVGFDLKLLFQPKQFYDSMLLVPNTHTLSVAVGRIYIKDFFSISSNNCILGKIKISFLMTPQCTQNYYSAHDPTSAIPANHKSLLWTTTAIRCNIKIASKKGQAFGCKSFSKLKQIRQLTIAPDCKRGAMIKIQLRSMTHTFYSQL